MTTLVQSAPIPEASFRQHYSRQQNQKPQLSYTAAVPVEESETTAAPGSSQPTLYKQINIIPGLDADNAVVDTGIKMVRPTGGQVQVSVNTAAANEFDGKRMRRSIQRRTVDYNASAIQMLKHRLYKKSLAQKPVIHPDPLYYVDIVQPRSILQNPINSVTTRFVRASTNKIRCPVFTVAWTPEGRRVVTGTSSGEFTLWNGLTFNFETILQAHESAVRAMEWSHNDMWLLSGDHNGVIKYWQSNMNNVKMIQAHTDPIRGLSFCPTDNKFVTCSDDGLLKVWDFYRCMEEETLRGHGADVKCCGWHPWKSLIASGSKDSQQPMKLWDPRTGASLATIHGHKSTVMDLQWNKNGNWILTGSRDRLLKVYDIRVMKDICTFRGHKKEAASVNWHPLYEEMFASGGSDGSIMFWLMGCEKELGVMDCAHDGMIWDLKWHPLGHILCSGSNDHTTKFWTRNRPADKMRDKYNLNVLPTGFEDDYEYELPDCSQSDGAVVVTDSKDGILNKSIPGKVQTEKVEDAKDKDVSKTNLNTPAVQALLDQTSLKVSKPDSTDAPAQVYTLSQLRPTAPAFKIDSSKQQQAIDEVERLEKRRERQLRKGTDKGRKRSADSDDDTCHAPSLLDLDIAPPAFIQEQEMQEQMEEANKRALQSNMPPQMSPANEHPRSDMPPSNWIRNDNGLIGPPFQENGNRKFEGPIRPQFQGVGPEGPTNFVRPPQCGHPVFDRPPQGGQPNYDRPLQGNPPNFDRPPEAGPPNFDRPPSNGPANFIRPPQSFNGPRPDDVFMDAPRPNEHFPNRPPGKDFDNRPRADEKFVDGPPPPRSIEDFGNRPPMDEKFNVPRSEGDFVNRPRQDGDVPPGPAGDFDKRPRNEEEFNYAPPRLAGDFDLRPLPDVDFNVRQRPAGDFDKRPPPKDNFPRPDIDGPRFDRDRPHIQAGLDGPPSHRFNNSEGPTRMHNEEPRRPLQFNRPVRFDGPPVDNRGPSSGPPQHNAPIRFDGPTHDNRGPPPGPPQHNAPLRFDGPPIDNRGPPSGPPQQNAPFEGQPNGSLRMDERFLPHDNFPHNKRWDDERSGADRWPDENNIPNRRPNEVNPINEPGPNWENMDREGLNRENRERR